MTILTLMWQDISDAGGTERNQESEGSFGSVSGGTEGVQAENRDARGGPDALFAIGIGA